MRPPSPLSLQGNHHKQQSARGGKETSVLLILSTPLVSHTHTHIQPIMASNTHTRTYLCIYAAHASSLMENRVQAHGYFIHQWLQCEG